MPHVESVNIIYGLVVKRLRHRPFTAVSGVRVPSRSPNKKAKRLLGFFSEK